MHKKSLITVAAVAVILIIAVVTITKQSSQGNMPMSTGSQSAVMTNQVEILNYLFSPMVITVKVGTSVTWTNKDSVNHTITADTLTKVTPSSMDIADGKSYNFTFTKPGTYTYHCFPHPYMHGTVIVE